MVLTRVRVFVDLRDKKMLIRALGLRNKTITRAGDH